jgi:hypothetical protein
MASCEYILDIASYQKIPPAPTLADRDTYGEAYFLQKLREHELARAGNVTKKQFFLAVRWFLEKQLGWKDLKPEAAGDETIEQEGLKLVDPRSDAKPEAKAEKHDLTPLEKTRLLAFAGLLIADSQLDALAGKTPEMLSAAAGDEKDESLPRYPVYVAAPFKSAMTRALAELNTYPALFQKVYETLRLRSRTGATPEEYKFRARQVGEIGRALIGERTDPNDPQFGARFDRALATSLSGATQGNPSMIDIDLPDLEAGTEADIISDNVKALSAIYFSAMLEELKFFSVMDKVVEQFMNGALPIKRGSAGDPLYRYHREAQLRINEFERRGLYARSFGVAQGSVEEEMPNREFSDLWIRFLSAVSVHGRELNTAERRMVSTEQVFKTARDLAVNLSLHGYGLAHFAAVELQTLIKSTKDTLSNPDVLAAYGVRDIWQLVERVGNTYLGGAVNGVRQRTMAASGAAIIQWLATSAPTLIGSLRTLQIDKDLISHVERWLAVTGTPDAAIEKYSEPVALQNQRTIPDFALPASAGAAGDAIRDALARINPATPQN